MFWMPRPCGVETHARGYKNRAEGLCGCYGLAPWRLTLAATRTGQKGFADATDLRRGGSRWRLQKQGRRVFQMPGTCAVEAHARGYKIQQKGFWQRRLLLHGLYCVFCVRNQTQNA